MPLTDLEFGGYSGERDSVMLFGDDGAMSVVVAIPKTGLADHFARQELSKEDCTLLVASTQNLPILKDIAKEMHLRGEYRTEGRHLLIVINTAAIESRGHRLSDAVLRLAAGAGFR